MKFEVEQKHCVNDVAALEAQLVERGAIAGPVVKQEDCYFAHPVRDFAATDEALRIRTVGDASYITYKGPKIDATTKTRRELELPLPADDGAGAQFAELLAALGFESVAVVKKQRRQFTLPYAGHEVEVALDTVDGVGTYVELELTADESQLPEAQQAIAALSAELDLGPGERRSYLEMLLERS